MATMKRSLKFGCCKTGLCIKALRNVSKDFYVDASQVKRTFALVKAVRGLAIAEKPLMNLGKNLRVLKML